MKSTAITVGASKIVIFYVYCRYLLFQRLLVIRTATTITTNVVLLSANRHNDNNTHHQPALLLPSSIVIPPRPSSSSISRNVMMASAASSSVANKLLKPVVICGPSGVGKGTLIEMLSDKYSVEKFGFSVSHTTRQPRPGEIDGIHYYFTTVEQMKHDIAANKFIEYAEVHGKYYGTSIAAVENVQKDGKICILDIDVQGVQKVKESTLEPYYVFVAPPSLSELEQRLRGRATETEDAIRTRLDNARTELEYGETPGNFDRIFVNNDLQACFDELIQQFQVWYPTYLVDEKENE